VVPAAQRACGALKVRTAAELSRPPNGDVRLFLLYGPDLAGAAEVARELEAALGAERLELDPRTLEADQSRLAAEAAAVSMFGDRLVLSVRGAGDGLVEAADLLLSATVAGNPAVVVAGDLPSGSRLRKLADGHPLARALACYQPSDAEMAGLAESHARALGLRLGPGVAVRLAELAGGERGVLAREVEKLADFADASAERPVRLELDALAAITAGDGAADLDPLLDAVTLGRSGDAARQLERLASEGQDGITLLRAAARRFALVAEARAGVDAGLSPEAAVKALRPFWKLERPLVVAARQWRGERIAMARARLLATERAIRAPASAGARLAAWALLALARAAASEAQRRNAAPTARR
jgi:DNA polymerase-3 subunit delta